MTRIGYIYLLNLTELELESPGVPLTKILHLVRAVETGGQLVQCIGPKTWHWQAGVCSMGGERNIHTSLSFSLFLCHSTRAFLTRRPEAVKPWPWSHRSLPCRPSNEGRRSWCGSRTARESRDQSGFLPTYPLTCWLTQHGFPEGKEEKQRLEVGMLPELVPHPQVEGVMGDGGPGKHFSPWPALVVGCPASSSHSVCLFYFLSSIGSRTLLILRSYHYQSMLAWGEKNMILWSKTNASCQLSLHSA